MRIAHIVSTYPPYYGGMGNVVFQTASHLSDLGHEVMVFTPQYYEKKEIRESASQPARQHEPELEEQIDYAKRLKTSISYGNAAYMPQVGKELEDFDIVHFHYPFFGTAGLVRNWKLKHPDKPLVITYHMDTRAPSWKGLIFKWYARYWLPKILAAADVLVTSSFDYLAHSDAAGIFNLSRKKWVEIPFGVDVGKFRPREKPQELMARHNLQTDIPTVLFVGGMDAAHYFKGVSILLEALLLLQGQGVEVQAVLVGDGELRQEYELKARGYGIAEAVRFVGRVEDEDLPSYYNLADLLVLPSTSRAEAFGMVLLEAMASGVPVLASNLPGVRSVAELGGRVFSARSSQALASSIAEYFDPQNNRTKWQKQARLVAEQNFSWEAVTLALDSVYSGLVD